MKLRAILAGLILVALSAMVRHVSGATQQHPDAASAVRVERAGGVAVPPVGLAFSTH